MRQFMLFLIVILCAVLTGCSSNTAYEERVSSLENELAELSENYNAVTKRNKLLEKDIENASRDFADMSREYESYKYTMSVYEEMNAAEAAARALKAKAEKESIEESYRQALEESRAEEKRIVESKDALGYETGITYNQLARTPDKFEGEKVKFTGTVIQIVGESDSEVDIRLAVNNNYDTVIIVGFEPDLVEGRLLENDVITVYGASAGLCSYQAVLGNTITIPAVWAHKIEVK